MGFSLGNFIPPGLPGSSKPVEIAGHKIGGGGMSGLINSPMPGVNLNDISIGGLNLNLGQNATDAIQHPLSHATGGIWGGSGGVSQFTSGGAGVKNSGLTGGMSNKNNRYGVIIYGLYLSWMNMGKGAAGKEAAGAGLGSGLGNALADAGKKAAGTAIINELKGSNTAPANTSVVNPGISPYYAAPEVQQAAKQTDAIVMSAVAVAGYLLLR